MIHRSRNDLAWENFFNDNNVLSRLKNGVCVTVSANALRQYREPRLMTKIDHTANRPRIFADHGLSILPLTRSQYVISHFCAYQDWQDLHRTINHFPLPLYLQSLDSRSINSESIAINCAMASGILADFLGEDNLVATVSGRMGTGVFDFLIDNMADHKQYTYHAQNAQMEIDAAYEGVDCLALVEAKRSLPDDFIIRQLYYPYRTWSERVNKKVRPIFMVYTNGTFILDEYQFTRRNDYNSIVRVKQKRYAIEGTMIGIKDIESLLNSVPLVAEPCTPFPQADSFERVINLCELLQDRVYTKDDLTDFYAFDPRQTNYYADAGRYLGLVEKESVMGIPTYSLSSTGNRLMSFSYRDRQLGFCELILSHRAFAEVMRKYLARGEIPSTKEIVDIMKASELYRVDSDSTFTRRASTVKSWLDWIIGLINE